jgi:hypothetical protein
MHDRLDGAARRNAGTVTPRSYSSPLRTRKGNVIGIVSGRQSRSTPLTLSRFDEELPLTYVPRSTRWEGFE